MTAAASAIEASGVAVRLGGRPVLADIDFALSPGELVGLIGPNGAGKTTLARSLAGLQPLARGRIAIDGEMLGRWPRKALARTLAYLPQAEGVSWDVTVEALVMLGRLPWREPWVAPG
ncbi:MAG TPA: ABC transporter ATP-binding protein, partial [Kiloniellales bacterium]|nr:ABC transporter ATP-binding protein [Kiloniellales bacterium]